MLCEGATLMDSYLDIEKTWEMGEKGYTRDVFRRD